MKKWLFVLLLINTSFISFAQSQFYSPCKDPLKIENPFHPCYDDYTPVCGCDGNTYRSPCSAENQFALNPGNYFDGPCSDFHYVIEPNLVNYYLQLRMYRKKAGYINVIIYDVYGHIFLQRTFALQVGRTDKEITETASYQHGLYILEIISDDERQVKKFYKVNNN